MTAKDQEVKFMAIQKREVTHFFERYDGMPAVQQLRCLAHDKGDYGYNRETYEAIRIGIRAKEELV